MPGSADQSACRSLPGTLGLTNAWHGLLRALVQQCTDQAGGGDPLAVLDKAVGRYQRRITLTSATSINPVTPAYYLCREGLYVGQNSIQIRGASGSFLGANQQSRGRISIETTTWLVSSFFAAMLLR